jgi:hypothetical protein
MTHIKTVLFFLVLAFQGTTLLAAEAVLSSDYLQGKWSESGKQGCTSDRAGYVIFNNNRTLEAGYGNMVSAVGFWELGEDTLTVHLLVSPAGGGGHPFYQKRYYYEYMSPKILSLKSDSLDYTRDTGAQAGAKQTLTRCQ